MKRKDLKIGWKDFNKFWIVLNLRNPLNYCLGKLLEALIAIREDGELSLSSERSMQVERNKRMHHLL
jgi:hypothetical protein